MATETTESVLGEGDAAASGMPQLDFATYPNQIFWLLIALVAIYFLLSRVALPRIGAVLAERQGTITNDVAAAEELGFERKQARELVLGTMAGTVAMAQAEGDTPLETLRNNVTSKGGTTAAGLDALNGDDALSSRLQATLTAAYDRARELR